MNSVTTSITQTSDSQSTSPVGLAAQIRSDAPGRGTSAPQAHRLTGVEFAEVIRANGPGRTSKS